jgi:hypothetical protein
VALAIITNGSSLLIAILAWLSPEALKVEMGRGTPISKWFLWGL